MPGRFNEIIAELAKIATPGSRVPVFLEEPVVLLPPAFAGTRGELLSLYQRIQIGEK